LFVIWILRFVIYNSMQQFQVPQYIEVEDKILGPLTIKQFIYVLGAGGLVLFLWVLGLPGIIFWPLALLSVGFFMSLAFYKVNGQPLIAVLNNALNQITHTRRYMWRREQKEIQPHSEIMVAKGPDKTPELTKNKLQDLSWTLDVNEKLKR
jgi:hypothetical protein